MFGDRNAALCTRSLASLAVAIVHHDVGLQAAVLHVPHERLGLGGTPSTQQFVLGFADSFDGISRYAWR